LGRLSGPLLDRIDLQIEMPAVPPAEIQSRAPGESSAAIRARVLAARDRQRSRFGGGATRLNSEMSSRQLRRFCVVPPAAEQLLTLAMSRLGLSARGHDRVLKV